MLGSVFSYSSNIHSVSHLEDETVSVRGVLPQSMFPGDGELCSLLVRPLDTWIFVAVDVFPQPRNEKWFTMRHFCGKGNHVHIQVSDTGKNAILC